MQMIGGPPVKQLLGLLDFDLGAASLIPFIESTYSKSVELFFIYILYFCLIFHELSYQGKKACFILIFNWLSFATFKEGCRVFQM